MNSTYNQDPHPAVGCAVHELGHSLGLLHNSLTTETMRVAPPSCPDNNCPTNEARTGGDFSVSATSRSKESDDTNILTRLIVHPKGKPTNLDQLADMAALVVNGVIIEVSIPRYEFQHTHAHAKDPAILAFLKSNLVTISVLEVQGVLQGDKSQLGKRITLYQHGGSIGSNKVVAEDNTLIQRGQRVVVFLDEAPDHLREYSTYGVIGFDRGLLVDEGGVYKNQYKKSRANHGFQAIIPGSAKFDFEDIDLETLKNKLKYRLN